MVINDEETVRINKWASLIKKGQLTQVIRETEGKQLDSKTSLACLTRICKLVYDDEVGALTCKIIPEQVFQLSESIYSFVNVNDSKDFNNYLSSLFHITKFLYRKNHFDKMGRILKIITSVKNNDPRRFLEDGKIILEPTITLIKMALTSEVSSKSVNQSVVTALFTSLLELMMTDGVLNRGAAFLVSIQQVGQTTKQMHDMKAAVHVITSGLIVFTKISKVADTDSCLPALFKVYHRLFMYQHKAHGQTSALAALASHLDKIKWNFSNNYKQGECLLLVSHTLKLLKWSLSKSNTIKLIEDITEISQSIEKSSEDTSVISACELIATLMSHSLSSAVLPSVCILPLLKIILKIYGVFKKSNIVNTDIIVCFCEMILITEELKSVLKQCFDTLLQCQNCVLEEVQALRNSNHPEADSFTKLMLIRFVNLTREYHIISAKEEVLKLSKPMCQFMCSLHPDFLRTQIIEQTLDALFTLLTYSMELISLLKGLMCCVAWLLKRPQSVNKVFKLWSDLKHNYVCYNKTEHLDISVSTILKEMKVSFREEWFEFELSDQEIGNFLIEEIKIYLITRTLRGKPVIAATNNLLSLKVDCLTQVRGLVMGILVASATSDFPDECSTYHNKSKLLAIKLRQQKSQLDQVMFNCSLANLLYAQLRCELRTLRLACETEMVHLTKPPTQPLVEDLPEDRPDPNDTCDISTKYSNLCLSKHYQLLTQVDSPVGHWGFAYGMMQSMPERDYDIQVTLECLRDLAYLLNLYCDEVKQVKVWRLLYSMAALTRDTNSIITAVGGLLNLNQEVDQEWMENAQQQLSGSEVSDNVKLAYQLSTCTHHLANNKEREGLELLSVLDQDPKKKHNIEYTKFLLVVGCYQQLSSWSEMNYTFNCSFSYYFSFHKALRHLLYLADEKKWDNFSEACLIQYQLISASRWLGESCFLLDEPREARSYLKPVLSLAQKLALPLRTVQLLLLLTWVDLVTGVLDDCVVKLQGLEDLLDLRSSPVFYNMNDNFYPPKQAKSFMIEPEFLSHSHCSCMPCSTVEYRRLVLETITLRATFCAYFGCISDAIQCFEVAVRVEETLQDCSHQEVHQACAHMWIRYADSLSICDRFNEAAAANSKAASLLPLLLNPYMKQFVSEQQNNLITHQLHQPSKSKIVIDNPGKEPSVNVCTPPTNKVPDKLPLSDVNTNCAPITPFARPVRPFKLPLSDEENTPPGPVSKSIQKTKQLPKYILKTPLTAQKSKTVKTSNTPFLVFDDNNHISEKSCKSKTTKKKTTKTAADQSKKQLFPPNNSVSDVKKSTTTEQGDKIVRQSRRRILVKPVDNNSGDNMKTSSTKKQDDTFTFNQMKNTINSIVEEDGARAMNDDDDIVEGTPPEPQKKTTQFIGLKRALRSKKT